MSSNIGEKIKIQIFGQSHSKGIGVTIDGLPHGFKIDFDKIYKFMIRRAPNQNEFTTARKETDEYEILSGINDGYTCGAPLCAVIYNKDQKSSDYDLISDIPRPSHADYPAHIKYNGFNDINGGGHFSGRLTAPMCFAGAIALQILEEKGIFIGSHIATIGSSVDRFFNPTDITKSELLSIKNKSFPTLDDMCGEIFQNEICAALEEGDSIGGIIECAAIGVPCGLGDGIFGGIENKLSCALFGIPAVKGIEFGMGFRSANLRGSEFNDEYFIDKKKNIRTKTNNNGGILGGISNGMPIIFRVAIKPTPSIYKEQNSISYSKNENAVLKIKGRHDPCIVLRALPAVEAVCAFTLLDIMM